MKLITNKSKEVSLRVTSCHYIGKIYKFLSSYIYPPKTIECITEAGEVCYYFLRTFTDIHFDKELFAFCSFLLTPTERLF